MNQDEIIEMARQAWISDKEAQLITEFDEAYLSCTYLTDLVAFAKLVADAATAKEREEIAQFLERTELGSLPEETALQYARLLKTFATSIRARGEA